MQRSFLWGLALGATLALGGVAVARVWIKDRPEPLYLRIADDNFHETFDTENPEFQPEDGPTSMRLIRGCKIATFMIDTRGLDHTGSSFVRIDSTPKAKLNCLIGEARAHSMSLAITRGLDTTEIVCVPGWPTRFRDDPPAEPCPRGNPDPIFRERHKETTETAQTK